MNFRENLQSTECSRATLHEYIDGELSLTECETLKAHLASCTACRCELNQQKNLFGAIDTYVEPTVELPTDFTEVVVANAGNQVRGLRVGTEITAAVAIITILATTTLLLVGDGLDSLGAFWGWIYASAVSVVFAVGGVVSNIATATTVIAKLAGSQIDFKVVLCLGFGLIVLMLARRQIAELIHRYSPIRNSR